MYRRIVVPLDGSPLAEQVLPHVTEVARDRSGQVHLLSVAPPGRGEAKPTGAPEEREGTGGELAAYLDSVAEGLAATGADVHVHVRVGRQADEILAFAGQIDADLVAMSTHGRSGIGRWVFGSVADRVLRRSTCPVLLVRAGEARRQVSYDRILVPLDGSELAEQVLPYVRALVHRHQTHVFLVSVLTTGLGDRTVALLTSYPPGIQLATTALEQAEVELRTYLRGVAAALRRDGAAVHVAIQRGSPAEEILAYASEVGVDVVAMTTHGFSGLSRWVYGNVAGRVLEGARCPVLLVRPVAEG